MGIDTKPATLNAMNRGVSRRAILAGAGAAGFAATMPWVRPAQAQEVTLRWWSPQTAPAQREAYEFQIRAFEAANPGVRIMFEGTSDEGYPAQMAAAFASGQAPSVVTHLPSFAISNYYANGLLEPFNDVIEMIGPEKYYEGANNVYEVEPNVFAGTGIGNTAANMMWLRSDLMERAGVTEVPRTWDELRAACQKMQGGGIFGVPLPYARNSATSLVIITFVHAAGGQIFTPDLEVAVDSQEFRTAMEFYKSMRELTPPGASGYSWGEMITAFVSGATATGWYAGRVLANVNAQNPAIAPFVSAHQYPTISRDVPHWTFNDFPSVMIPKGTPNLDVAKRFAASLFDPPGYIRQLHAAPGHILPVLKTISAMPEYQENPIIQRHSADVELMASSAAAGHNLGWETVNHKPNFKAGQIIASHVFAEAVQRYVMNNDNLDTVVSDTAKRLEELMKG